MEALLLALDQQVLVVAGLGAEILAVESACAGWSVRDVLNHSIGVTSKFADFAAGITDRPRTPVGDLIRADHNASLRETVDRARSAWSSADMTRTCHLSFGTFSTRTAAGINLFDAMAHTWDIASVVGVEMRCPDDVWNAALESARELIGEHRDPTHYGDEIPVPTTASPRSRFLCFLGRADDGC